MADLPADDLSARFELGAPLGSGGFGTVFRARDLGTGREVAIKRLAPGTGASSLVRFAREAAVTAALQHPGIVRVHAAGTFAGTPCIVYELVEGETLDVAARVLNPRRRVELVRDAARAVGHAHASGVIHRDLKAENILVGHDGRVRVADFGLARSEGSDHLTRTGALVGTPTHVPPEALLSGPAGVGPPGDVWSLGVVLFEVLTGRLPFDGTNLVTLMAQVQEGRIPRLRSIDPGIDPAFEAVCLRALTRDPARRFQDAGALAAALDDALAGAAGRRPLGRALAAAVALVLGGVAAAWAASGHGPARAGPAPVTTSTPPRPVVDASPATPPRPIRPRSFEVTGATWSVWLSPSDLLVGGPGVDLRRYDVTKDGPRGAWRLRTWAADCLPDGAVMVVADHALHRFDADEPSEPRPWLTIEQTHPLRGDGSLACALRAQRAVCTVGWNATTGVIVVDTSSPAVLARWETPTGERVSALAISPDGRAVAVAVELPLIELAVREGELLVFDVIGATLRLRWQRRAPGVIRALACSPDGARLHVGTIIQTLIAYDLAQGTELGAFGTLSEALLGRVNLAHTGRIMKLASSPDGARLFSTGETSGATGFEVKTWDVATRRELHQTETYPGQPGSLAISPDGRHVAIVSEQGRVVVQRVP